MTPFLRGHTLITLAHKDTYLALVSKSEQNANLVNRPYLVNMLTRVLTLVKNRQKNANLIESMAPQQLQAY